MADDDNEAEFWGKASIAVSVSRETFHDFMAYNDLMYNAIEREMHEAMLDMTGPPRLGPKRVPNDAELAELERRNLLADALRDVAIEWGVLDLIEGDRW